MQLSPAFCPACGAPLHFRPGAQAVVCAFCGELVAQGNHRWDRLGRMDEPEDTGSPLSLGLEGEILGRPFVLAGRTQTRSARGTCRDEWCLAFKDGLWGRLTEEQGHFVLLFPRDLEGSTPDLESLEAGHGLELGSTGTWIVAWTGRTPLVGAEGELPWPMAPGASIHHAELQGERKACASLEAGDPARLFMGRAVALEELRLHRESAAFADQRRIRVLDLNCPACGAGLALRAPDRTRRVVCPVCAGLLDASQGHLVHLEALEQGPPSLLIPLGAEGRLGEDAFTCVGFLEWRCTLPDEASNWREYLLLDASREFRRLLERDGHWSLAQALADPVTQELREPDGALRFRDQWFRRFQDVELRLRGAWGEFPWELSREETLRVVEYARAPESLLVTVRRGAGSEPKWGWAQHLEGAEVWRAFSLPGEPPAPLGVGPHQPNPHWPKVHQMGLLMLAALALLLCIAMLASATHSETLLFRGPLDPACGSSELLTPPISVQHGHRNLALRVLTPSSPGGLAVQGALVGLGTGETQAFEGAGQIFLSAVPPGIYVLRLAPHWEGRTPTPLVLELRSGVLNGLYPALVLGVILFFPLLMLLQAWAFEERRWLGSALRSAGPGEAR